MKRTSRLALSSKPIVSGPRDRAGAAPTVPVERRETVELPPIWVNWPNEIALYALMLALGTWIIWLQGSAGRWLTAVSAGGLAVALIAGYVGLIVGRRHREEAAPASAKVSDVPMVATAWQSPDGRWWSPTYPPTRFGDDAWRTPDRTTFDLGSRPFFLQRRSHADSWSLLGQLGAIWTVVVVVATLLGFAASGARGSSASPSASEGSLFAVAGALVVVATVLSVVAGRRWSRAPDSEIPLRRAAHPWPGVGSASGAQWHQRGAEVRRARYLVALAWGTILFAWLVFG